MKSTKAHNNTDRPKKNNIIICETLKRKIVSFNQQKKKTREKKKTEKQSLYEFARPFLQL